MRDRADRQILYNVAKMYYLEGKKQEEIAALLKRSRSSVSMLLTEAREAGIVEIKLKNPLGNDDELSELFESRFGLSKCYVVPTSLRDTGLLIKLVAESAVDVFNAELRSNDTIGVAWGRTCYEFMSQYYNDSLHLDLNLVPLIGGSNLTLKRYQLNHMVRDFAEKLNAVPHFIHAPAMADSLDDYRLYRSSSVMKRITGLWEKMDMAVVSIGMPPGPEENDVPDYLGGMVVTSPEFRNRAGDICGWPIDEQGHFLSGKAADLLIACGPDQLRKTKKVFGLVAGLEKRNAVRAGLLSGIIDYLIIDEQTARAVADDM